MKNKLLKGLAAAAFCGMALFAQSAKAQVTALTIDVLYADSSGSGCTVPYTTSWMEACVYYTGNVVAPDDTMTIYVNYGDGSDTTFDVAMAPPGSWGTSMCFGVPNHTYTLPGVYTPLITATTEDAISVTATDGPTYTFSDDCAPLTGDLYIDADNDCSFDAGELPLIWFPVVITNTTTGSLYYAYTDAMGHYSADLASGYTYTVAAGVTGGVYGLTVTCPSAGSATVTAVSGGTYSVSFGYECDETEIDMSVDGYAWNWRPGYERPMYIHAYMGNFCSDDAATVTATLPAQLSYLGGGANPPSSVAGSVLTWNVPAGVSLYDYFWSNLPIFCDPSATMGDTLCIELNITPVSVTDGNLSNNTYSLCAEINNSMDPNQKGVAPKGLQEQGYIAASTAPMTYLVEFQNTGNDVAYNVTIANKIDAHLNLSTLKVLGTSHPLTAMAVGEDREVKFRFAGINLPDSLSDEPASHGYVLYSIEQANMLAPGTEITNTANIFFDYNEAIVTNTTLNTIEIPSSIQQLSAGSLKAEVFPNPAGNTVSIRVKSGEAFSATLSDMTGRAVQSVQGTGGNATIATDALASGLYLLHITNGNGGTLSTKLEVKH